MGDQPDADNTEDRLAETVSGVRAGLGPGERWAYVKVVYPEVSMRTIPVRGLEAVVLGRNPGDNEAHRIAHRTVSRTHLKIAWDPGARGFGARDLGSRNGTWIDGAPLKDSAAILANDSVLRIGDVLAVFEWGEHPVPDGAAVSTAAIPGDTAGARAVRGAIERAAADPSPVLVIGETGTGKELVSAEIHRLSGRKGPLISFNCAELSPTVIESQLFGHEKGAFTGAAGASPGLFRAANGGTIFLDELGELPLDLQPKLLRVIQEGEVLSVGGTQKTKVDVRVVAATNRELIQEIDTGRFRRDLYARVSLWEVRLPPLRQRRGDILSWVNILHQAWLKTRGREAPPIEFEPDAAEALLLFSWSENLRGLDRLVHSLASTERTRPVMLQQLPSWLELPAESEGGVGSDEAVTGSAGEPGKRLPIPTREELVAALEQHEWVIRAVAKHFGRDRRQIYRWLESHGIRRE